MRRALPAICLAAMLAAFPAAPGAGQAGARERGAGVITGVATLDGRPMAGVTVSLAISGRPDLAAVTDAQGAYTIGGVPPGAYFLKPIAPGYCLAGDIDFVRITLDGSEGPQQVDLRLTRAGSVEGRVTEAEGRAVAGATVFLSKLTPQNQPMPGRMLMSAKTDAAGGYRFTDVQPGQYRLFAKPYFESMKPLDQRDDRSYTECYYPAGASPASSVAITVSPFRPLTGMEIQCGATPPGFTASGRAIDSESGAAVANIQLVWGAIDNNGGAVLRDNVNLRSDGEGRFTITGLVPGTYWVGVFNMRSGARYGRPVFFDVARQSVSGVDVQVHRGVLLSGIVVADPPGSIAFDRPPINVLFRPTQISTTFVPRGSSLSGLFQKSATVTPDGRFSLEGVPPGHGQILVSTRAAYGVRMLQNGVELPTREFVAGPDTPELRVVLTTGTGTIRGYLRSKKPGIGVNRYSVSASLAGAADGASALIRDVKVNPDGRFVIDALPAGNYRVMGFWYIDGRMTRRVGPVVSVTLAAGGVAEIEIDIDSQ